MSEKPKRQIILEAAFEVFSSKGFYAAKVDEIAEKAGIGKGTIYEYFKSKSHVFQEMYKWYIEEYFSDLESGITQSKDPVVVLYGIVKNHVIFMNRFKNLAGKMLSESTSHADVNVDPNFKKVMIERYKVKVEELQSIFAEGVRQGIFRDDIDVQFSTIYFFSSFDGLCRTMLLFDMEITPDGVARKVVDLLLKGIKKDRG
ncbi:MAG: TetR/AcrR family transcriptional regulator [Peptococcaceae bacterium]